MLMFLARVMSWTNPKTNPLHRMSSLLSLCMWSTLWEGDYSPGSFGAPGEDECYDVMALALQRALRDPNIRKELQAVLRSC